MLLVLVVFYSFFFVFFFFFFQAEDGIRDRDVTGVQTCALPISRPELPCGFFADNDNILRVAIILIREVTTADDRNTHCGEITGSGRTVDDVRLLPRRRIWYSFHTNAHRVTVVGEGKITGDSS